MHVRDIPFRHGVTILLCLGVSLCVCGQTLPTPQSAGEAMTRIALPAGGDNAATSGRQTEVVTPPAMLDGRFPLQLGLTAGGYFDDNIYARPESAGKKGDFIWSLSPLLAWNSASVTGATVSVQLAYAPTILFYQEHDRRDTVDQSATAVFAYEGARLEVIVSEAYSSVQEASADAGRLIIETASTTTAVANYQISGKTSLEATARQTYTGDDPGLRSIEWTLSSYFNYQATPKTYFSLGDVLGAVELEGPNQTYEQLNGRIGYNPDSKLSFSATGGAEFRETQGRAAAEATPDFSLGSEYEPFDGTDINLSAYRRYDYSGRFYGDDYLATGASASISQRFLRRFHFSVAGTFENAQYHDNRDISSIEPSYDYFSLRPVLRYEPRREIELQLFYQYRRSLAQGGVSSFSDNQAGFAASITY